MPFVLRERASFRSNRSIATGQTDGGRSCAGVHRVGSCINGALDGAFSDLRLPDVVAKGLPGTRSGAKVLNLGLIAR
jgi:hypothetical protein